MYVVSREGATIALGHHLHLESLFPIGINLPEWPLGEQEEGSSVWLLHMSAKRQAFGTAKLFNSSKVIAPSTKLSYVPFSRTSLAARFRSPIAA